MDGEDCGGGKKKESIWNESFQKGEAERKFIQNSFRGTARSTRFRRTERVMEHLIPLHFVSSHVPNGVIKFSSLGPPYI
ncbi:hypothetical protein DVH24_030797 [Malus domestica]|uniref:Uncharacterized protein n=1 Tax=Malus domestica TaxID=3750 RepID=A0A498HDW3_MALDO|nr:hypothetical protein DVH24_030797 [Malus domestica]